MKVILKTRRERGSVLKKASIVLLCTVAMILCTTISVSASVMVPYLGYEYNSEEESVPAPVGYEPSTSVLGTDIGCGLLETPTDMCFHNGYLYLLDSGNSRIIVTDKLLQFVREIGKISQKKYFFP